ncbi:MAG: LysR substrate-binding domain-containing protein [Acidobacteriota bacterium]|nr:LysR substrate-binding domain-containing protein [Acidobacteriota bacterium]
MPRIRVTAPVEMSMSLLPRVLPEFGTQFPDVFVEINGLNRNLGLIEEGFDLAIRAGALVDSSYLSRKLPSDRFRLVAAPKMAAGIQSAAQLAVTPCVEVAGPPPELSGYWNGERFSVRSPAVAKLDSFTAALPLVLSGKAYAVMPKHVAGDYLADGKLHELTAVRLDEITLHALYPRRHRKQPALSTFIDMVAVLLDRQSG